MTIELRNYEASLSGDSPEGLFVRGIVNKPGSWSVPLPAKGGKTFIERIMPNAFTNALQRGNDVHFYAEHDPEKYLSSTKNDSLKLSETDDGLLMEARISPTTWGKDYHTLISEGLLANMSFGMKVLKDEWTSENGISKRSITDLALFEVSAVKNPAYLDSQIQSRSLSVSTDVEIPAIEEKEKTKMNEKSLEERKAELYADYQALEGLDENKRKELLGEIRSINEQIKQAAVTVPTTTIRNEEINMNETLEQRTAVEQFIRGIDGDEVRTLTAGTGVGALTVPVSIHNEVVEKMYEVAPLFGMSQSFTPVNGFLEILRTQSLGGPTAVGFVGEMTDLPKADFTMDKVRLDQKRVGSYLELSQHLINDSGIDVVAYATNILSKRVGLTLDRTIINGDKATQFEGLLNAVAVEDFVTASATGITPDELLNVYTLVDPHYIGGAVWVVSRPVFNTIAKLKDNDGHYFLVRDVAETGVTYKLFGQPILINDAMPGLVANTRSVLFGNFGEGYATMVKKGLSLKKIDSDTTNALRGSTTLVLDGYMDGKVLNENCFKFLKQKA